MLVDILEKIRRAIKRSEIIKPLINIRKKYILNPRHKMQLKTTDFPSEVWIENTNYCNASCVMCPYDSMTRKQGFMDFSLFKNLIEEISTYPVNRVHLHNFGEPLLDKELPRRIKLAKEHGVKLTYIVTNGSLLDHEKSSQLIQSGLDEFKISFYGTDSKTYNATMRKLDFEKTLDNVKSFFEIRRNMKAKRPKLTIQYLSLDTNESDYNGFINIFKPLIDKEIGDRLISCDLHDYGGGSAYKSLALGKPLMTCHYPWKVMVVLHDGRVSSCCLDYNGEQILGDVSKQSIKEVWGGRLYREMREDFLRLDYKRYPICQKCNIVR